MRHDLWLCRYGESIWYVWCMPGEPPAIMPNRASSVKEVFQWLRKAGIRIGQVGIADSDMLGLVDYH